MPIALLDIQAAILNSPRVFKNHSFISEFIMKTFKSTSILSTFILSLSMSLAAGVSHASEAATATGNYGTTAPEQSASRKIVIEPGTKWVNVTNGEAVTFIVGDSSFTYQFQTYANTSRVEMNAIAPAGLDVSGIKVYVAQPAVS